MRTIEITDFRYNKHLRNLMAMYVSRTYEENAIFDNHHLLMEYELLKRNGELNLLFEEEWFSGFMNDPKNY
jgi:hypothetical protein